MNASRLSKTSTVGIGSTVRVKSPAGEIMSITIVHPNEVDPAQGRISFHSPLGKALLGKRPDERVSYSVEGRVFEAEIIEINPPNS